MATILTPSKNLRPHLPVTGLSEAEAADAIHLDMLLDRLRHYGDQFERALGLYLHCENLLNMEVESNGILGPCTKVYEFHDWMTIAARDAAMTIYHYSCVLDALHKRIGCCPTLMPFLDRASLTRARRLFHKHFPRAERIRHGLGHSAELAATPNRLKQNSTSKKFQSDNITIGSNVFIQNSVSDGKLMLTRNGELLQIKISQNTLNNLLTIQSAVFDAFRAIEVAFSRNPVSALPRE